jgi:hypothetical protein
VIPVCCFLVCRLFIETSHIFYLSAGEKPTAEPGGSGAAADAVRLVGKDPAEGLMQDGGEAALSIRL